MSTSPIGGTTPPSGPTSPYGPHPIPNPPPPQPATIPAKIATVFTFLLLFTASCLSAQTCTAPCVVTIPAAARTVPTNVVTYVPDSTGTTGNFWVNGKPIINAAFGGNLTSLTFNIGSPANFPVGVEYDFIAQTNGYLTPHQVTPSTSTTTVFNSYTLSVPAIAAGGVGVGVLKLSLSASAQFISATPILTGAPSTDITLGHGNGQGVIYNGSLYVTVWNYGKQTLPAQKWVLLVNGQ